MIIFLTGYSGSGKGYYADLLKDNYDFKVFNISKYVLKHGINKVKKNYKLVTDSLIKDILKTDKHVVIDGIRQPDIFFEIYSQVDEKTLSIFLDNDWMIRNLLRRDLSFKQIYEKIKLDNDLGLLQIRNKCEVFHVNQSRKGDSEFLERVARDLV